MRYFVVTTNSWYDIWSLNRTLHFETDGINYEIIKAKNHASAKRQFQLLYDVVWTDIKCRLLENSGLYGHSEKIKL